MEESSSRRRESTFSLAVRDDYSASEVQQLFTAIPALNEAASYLAHTTSYFTRCFPGSAGDVEPDEGQELMTLVSEQDTRSLYERESTVSEQVGDNTSSSINEEMSASSVGSSSPWLSARIFQNGSSIFKDLVDRARKTVRGSADDIGWLQQATDMPPVEDGTKRFQEILESIRNNEHKLPNSVVYLLVPGLFSNHGPLYFVNTKTYFSKMGLACHIARIHSEASVEKNAREIKQYIEEIFWGSQKRVLLLGHSKGGVDAAAALSLYWSDLKDKVAGLALAQSPYGGSPIASDILREGQLGDYVSLRKIMEVLICKIIKGDLQALEDLTYERRKEFLRKHPLPQELPVVSFHTEAGIVPGVLATLSPVAHAELPIITSLADGQPAKLPVVMPLGAAMAACAQLLQVRYREKSDGLVTRRDAEVPGSVVVRPEQKLDHAWMVYSSPNNEPVETDASKVCEALLTLLVEVAQKRRHEISNKDE
ncbi:unnamed protein product [Musa acuminata subsp. malaccensis]|uniref:(wild Malaysian banana) hypothetical protein n=1 Tax=Musa acuminata subsp. malaccensis TaxID=214687 RepID=A0A804ITA6_MUSAM|nr:PREDICTED: uncharacterized protein LOC103975607 [Musa acuminata subsp. malaccensis]CAG1843225.1 unnamed protein product [Musa acuminata subsp. malaccensis]